uniref:Uncharacterized protein n=1 Tax=Vespula pensylvanica TaxID=30213 RepID=A0A834UCP2_VESPE|nr:hypothetical protein H0235_004599 [Vespula pensylvanica]
MYNKEQREFDSKKFCHVEGEEKEKKAGEKEEKLEEKLEEVKEMEKEEEEEESTRYIVEHILLLFLFYRSFTEASTNVLRHSVRLRMWLEHRTRSSFRESMP